MTRRQFVASSLAPLALRSAPAATRSSPNIVLIYADDVGYGDLSCYGASAVHTPNLDRLAGAGLRFNNLHASSATCTPSRYSLLTGQYAWRKPGTGVLPGDASLIVDPARPTVPSILKQAGYATAAIGKWHLGLGSGNIDWNGDIRPGPLEVGFDSSFIIPATPDRVPCVFVENHRVANLDPRDPIHISYTAPLPGELTAHDHPELLTMPATHGHDQALIHGIGRIGYMTGGKSALWVDQDIALTLTAKATHFIETNKNHPFFLYFASNDIHVPRTPNPRFVGKTAMGPRGDSIAELDWCVGQVLDCLERNHLEQNTLVLFSSDNGPVVDDGYRDLSVEKLGAHKPTGPYRGGKYSIFDGGTRVPMIARWPGHIKPDTISGALISQVDLLSSFASLTGQSVAHDAAPDSLDMLPALLGHSQTARKSLVEHAGSLALIEGNWKYVAPSHGPRLAKGPRMGPNEFTELGNDPEPQLYDLLADPGERANLASAHPGRVRHMAELLAELKSSGRSRP